ncbi:Polyprenyltransferase (cytochrome oxidase assembly factor) [Dehalobacter sp. DCA]|nr:Polyprenyltransferase (cytochrome oxidase assembly factor) [Dehalobacter sp. DCA]AFV05004.1 Polyprenyltransferase (cytochrome oxidase assembly factor) [Dehalobacter sp. CF]
MALKNYPDEVRKIEIEQNDERNLTITNKAKAKAYDKMIYVYGAIILAFGLMQIDLMAIIILVISYLFVVFSGIYYRSKYEKEM